MNNGLQYTRNPKTNLTQFWTSVQIKAERRKACRHRSHCTQTKDTHLMGSSSDVNKVFCHAKLREERFPRILLRSAKLKLFVLIFWMKASRCACNSINVTQIYVSTIHFILKQGYVFRLEVSHLQAPTTFSLPDALPTLGSHSVYICGIHFSLNFLKVFDYGVCYLQIVFKH